MSLFIVKSVTRVCRWNSFHYLYEPKCPNQITEPTLQLKPLLGGLGGLSGSQVVYMGSHRSCAALWWTQWALWWSLSPFMGLCSSSGHCLDSHGDCEVLRWDVRQSVEALRWGSVALRWFLRALRVLIWSVWALKDCTEWELQASLCLSGSGHLCHQRRPNVPSLAQVPLVCHHWSRHRKNFKTKG